MRIIQKIKNYFKKPELVFPEPLEIKKTIIPTEHLRAKVIIPNNLFLEENPYELENQAKNLILRKFEPAIKDRLNIIVQQSHYGGPYEVTADIFIGFGGKS